MKTSTSPVQPGHRRLAKNPAPSIRPTARVPVAWALALALGVGALPLAAQSISTDGTIESTLGGFRFPDGSVQTTAAVAGGGLECSAGDFLYCYSGPAETLGVGACRPGTRVCDGAGTGFEPCAGEVLPAPEVCDGVDNDCDGAIDPGGLCDGELVITEILYDSSGVPDETFEWFEIFNPNDHPVNLLGWTIRDEIGSGQQIVVVSDDLIVGPGAYAVLCHNGEPALNGGVVCDYEYGHFSLSNTADEIILEAGGVVIDAVAYDEGSGWPAATTGSLTLDPASVDVTANDDPMNWCNSPDGGPEIANGDEGSPGAANPGCG